MKSIFKSPVQQTPKSHWQYSVMTDLVLYNANVITMDPHRPRARRVLIRNGVVAEVSSDNQRLDHCPESTFQVDCRKKTVLPGFIDSHFHFRAFADRFVTLDLSPGNNIRSIREMQQAIHDYIAKIEPGTWIRAKGYDEFRLAERRHPNRWDLDAVTTRHPVKVTHRTGHAHVLNSLALQRVGLHIGVGEPPGGIMDRDVDTGEPTGLLYEMGGFLAGRIPPIPENQIAAGVEAAGHVLLQMGITSFHDTTASNGLQQWNAFADYQAEGALHSRVRFFLGIDAFLEAGPEAFQKRFASSHQLALGGVKIILDESTGRLLPEQAVLNEIVRDAHNRGLPVAIHAIEPNAVACACAAIEQALHEKPKADHRHRIEHCSVCPPKLVRRISELGVIVVSQPPFIYYNGDRYLQTVEKGKSLYLYPFKTLWESNIRLAGGSDCPVVPPNPFIGIYGAVTRKCKSGKPLIAGERLSLEQAITMYTRSGAFSGFEETQKGSITPGKLGDVVVLDSNLDTMSMDDLKEISVKMTICGGVVKWSK
jgi:predicted amidohydrolase YtcJ